MTSRPGEPPAAPAAAAVNGRRRFQHFQPNLRYSRPPDVNGFGGSQRKIDHPADNKRPAVGDAHDDRLAGSEVGHPHQRIHGQRAMRCGGGIHIVDTPVGAAPVVVRRSIPTGQSLLDKDGRHIFQTLRIEIRDRRSNSRSRLRGGRLGARGLRADGRWRWGFDLQRGLHRLVAAAGER